MKVAAGATGSVQKREGEAGRAASTKTILDGISGRAVPGELLAIMGPSGAGKTSLLNCLSHRNTGFEGKVLVNKKPLSDQTFASITAYMHQTELFLPDLTVREHLAFKARLQLDPSMSSAERAQRVSKVIFQLGLQESADVQIGWPNGDGRGAGGISRNERKRLNFATEIISEPSLLFVDERTTGLDSHMAESVVRQLRRLADPDDDDDDDEGNGEWEEKDKGGNASSGDSARRSNTGQRRTVIATIHQPSSDIFRLFHRLLLLVDGRVAYQGPAAAVADYFARIEYPVPDYVNPADFLMRLFVDPQRPDESMRNRATICDAYTALPASSALATCAAALPPGAAGFDPPPRYTTSCCRQLAELTARDVRMRARSKLALRTALARTVVLGVFFGLLFLRYDVDQASFAFVNVCLFFLVFIPGLTTAMTMTQELPAMMPTVLREHKGGSYHVGVYILSKYLVDVPYDGVLCLMWAAIIYWMAGFGAWSGRTFFLFFLIVWLTGYAFAGIGYMASACTRDPNVATIILIAVMIPSMLFGGLMIPLNAMPVFLGWLAELSTVRYGFELMMRAQWQDYGEIPCPASIAPSPLGQTAVDHVVGGNTTTMPSPSPSGEVGRAGGAAATASVRSPRCPPLTGSLVISKTGMSEGAATMWRMVGLLIGWAFLFRLIAALCLVRRARRSQAMGTIADTHQSLRGGGDNDGGDSGGGDGGGGGGKIKKEGVNGEAGGGRGGDGSTDPVGNDNDQSGGVAAAAPPDSGRGDDEAAAATSTSVIAVARREAAEEEAELDVAAPVQPEENDNAPAAAAAAVVETETKAREPAIALTVGRMEEGGGDKDEGQVHVEKMRVMGTREDKVEVLLQWRDLSFAVRRARPSGGKDKAATKTGKKTRPNAAAVVDEGGPTTAATTTSGSSSSSSSASSEFRVLDRVSGEAAPGEMVAVMGPSGCGKSTLLQCLAMRQVPTGGAVTMNGEPAASVADSMRRHTAFMHQEERFFGLLTVREHLQFQARLRMDATLPLGRRLAVVEACIDELGLGKCAATQIGEIGAGISGGERKRLSFATEMLVDPSVFLSDEPTSGLDSSMAESVVGYMRALARGLPGQGIPRRTIVVTIHQPSAEIFALFDKLVILARGRVAFFGKAADALGYFDSLAQPGGGAIDGLTVCPKDTNPADHFMRLISTLVDDKAASTLAAAATDSEDGGSGGNSTGSRIAGCGVGACRLYLQCLDQARGGAARIRRSGRGSCWLSYVVVPVVPVVIVFGGVVRRLLLQAVHDAPAARGSDSAPEPDDVQGRGGPDAVHRSAVWPNLPADGAGRISGHALCCQRSLHDDDDEHGVHLRLRARAGDAPSAPQRSARAPEPHVRPGALHLGALDLGPPRRRHHGPRLQRPHLWPHGPPELRRALRHQPSCRLHVRLRRLHVGLHRRRQRRHRLPHFSGPRVSLDDGVRIHAAAKLDSSGFRLGRVHELLPLRV